MIKLINVSTASRSRSNQDPIAGNRYSWHAQLGRVMANKTGYAVECWSLDVAVQKNHDETVDGVRYRVFPSNRFVMPYREWSTELLHELREELRSNEVILHLHNVHSWLTYAICRSFRQAHIVGHSHSAARPPIGRLASIRKLPFAPVFLLEQCIENQALRSIGHCFLVNTASGQYFRRHNVPVSFCPMALDLTQIRPHDFGKARQHCGLSQHDAVLLSVGGFVKTKGLELLLSAFSEIAQHCPIHLLIVGHTYDQAYRTTIERQIRQLGLTEKITVIDHLPREKLSQYYAAADALLVTSTPDEGGPMVALEACAVGTSVIATPVGFIPDFAPRANGLITISSFQHAQYAHDVLRVLERPPVRHPTILWTWDDVARTILPIYEKLLMKKSS
jgi:glycosyltransferase involved in cell wall biosynthesis